MTPKDVADLFSDLKRPVSSREVIGHHLWVCETFWRRLVKRHRSSSCSFACELVAGQQSQKDHQQEFLGWVMAVYLPWGCHCYPCFVLGSWYRGCHFGGVEMFTRKHCGRGWKLECDHPVVDQRRSMFQCSETRERNL
jgi:hypothetical protein